jgi:hypothetical protein
MDRITVLLVDRETDDEPAWLAVALVADLDPPAFESDQLFG